MKIFARLRENNKIIGALVAWQKTMWFPFVYAVLGVLSCTFGMYAYVPVFWIYTVTVVFAALFNDDVKIMLVPLFLSYFALGGDRPLDFQTAVNDVLSFFEPAGLINLLACGGIICAAIIYKFAETGVFKTAVKKRGLFTVGLISLSAAFLLNGVFSASWEPLDLAYGVLEALGITVVYFLVLGMADKTEDLVGYACKVIVFLGFMILAETVALSLKLWSTDELFIPNADGGTEFYRNRMVFAWGVSTLAGGVLALTIPAAMYIANTRKHCVLSYVAATCFMLCTIYLNGRTSILFGALAFAASILICCFCGKNKIPSRYFTLVLVGIGLVAAATLINRWGGLGATMEKLMNVLRFDDADNGRFARWADGWQDFLAAPVFGVGFMDGAVPPELAYGNMFSNMYHNIGLQLLGGMGAAGVLAFLVHLKNFAEVVIRKFSADKVILCLLPLLVILMSILDNFFFMLNIQIIYGAFLAVAERCLEEHRAEDIARVKKVKYGKKPRVVFTLVEAGKGHLISAHAVCSAFKEKYGDRCEVVESYFYTETGDGEMEKFEKGFSLAVKLQNKSGVVGALCGLGNFLCGDALSQQYLMAMTVGGVKSMPQALEHVKELDADLIFTTHWATAFYAGKIKGPHPYTMMYCPDVYSNGMFNIDCNEFLISTKEGYDKLGRKRMYAGGNDTLVPYPIRSQAYKYLGRREEIRKELGAEDSFVVALSDGGYGMARLEDTVRALAEAKQKLTLIALCGTNEALVERLKNLKTSPSVKIIAVGFTGDVLGYIAAADLFVGKGGANSIAEPAFFGVPVIITRCITFIEMGTKKYYVNKVGGGLFINSAAKAAAKVLEFAAHPERLAPYAEKMTALRDNYGAEAFADHIWERVSALPVDDSPAAGE